MFQLKIITIALLALLGTYSLAAQVGKPVIDTAMLYTWPCLTNDIKLSPDGRYVAYTITNQPVGYNTLVLQALQGGWKKELITAAGYFGLPFYFTADSRQLLVQHSDSLILETLGRNQPQLLALTSGPCLLPKSTTPALRWIAWRPKDRAQYLVLHNLVTGRQQTYPKAGNVAFNEAGTVLLVQQEEEAKRSLRWIDLDKKLTTKLVWQADTLQTAGPFYFDKATKQLCFLVKSQDGAAIFYYQPSLPTAVEKYNSTQLPAGWKLAGLQGFNETNRFLLAGIVAQKEPKRIPDPNRVAVDLWDYRDPVIHPAQIAHFMARFTYDKKGLLSIPAGIQTAPAQLLNTEGLYLWTAQDYCLLSNDTVQGMLGREHWVLPPQRRWLQHLDGTGRRELPFTKASYVKISPSGRWLLCWVNERGKRADFYSHEIATGHTRNLTGTLPLSVAQEKIPMIDSIPVGIAAWYTSGETVLLYDNYDIWQLDLTGRKSPVNLTGGYGLQNNIKLRLVPKDIHALETILLNGTEELLLTGYHEQTKYNGFFTLKLGIAAKQALQQLSLQPFTWFKTGSQVGTSALPADLGIVPLAGGQGNSRLWVLKGESATEYPNYYYTRDFTRFTPISQLAPQKDYNWLTTEIVYWPLPDGQTGQGVLYKPENFDSTKKYPVLFNYYERKSGWLYQLRDPGLCTAELNIPWFVSRGYLVFTPDIPFSDGSRSGISVSEHAFLAVESAAEYLSKRPYVDSIRLGLQGASFGGQLTLGIYTRSKRFAAASEGAGFTDDMSNYLGMIYTVGNGTLETTPVQAARESGHALYGATPWEKPQLYLDNSAVWRADRIGGPLLIMHNKKDEQVPWKQAVEMYMALRRLQKPCWMLQYDGLGHSVGGKAARDYTIRMTQFFDHYLKGAPAPRWMTQGIRARFKQVEELYEPDPAGSCSRDCRFCPKSQ